MSSIAGSPGWGRGRGPKGTARTMTSSALPGSPTTRTPGLGIRSCSVYLPGHTAMVAPGGANASAREIVGKPAFGHCALSSSTTMPAAAACAPTETSNAHATTSACTARPTNAVDDMNGLLARLATATPRRPYSDTADGGRFAPSGTDRSQPREPDRLARRPHSFVSFVRFDCDIGPAPGSVDALHLGWRNVADGFVQAVGVEPADALDDGELELRAGAPCVHDGGAPHAVHATRVAGV